MRRSFLLALWTMSLTFLAAAGSSPLPAADGPRNVIVFFEFVDDTNGVKGALEIIFNKMLGPGDQLIIQSPARVYGFSQATLAKPKAELIALMSDKLRGDITQAGQNYQQVIKDLETAVRNLEGFILPTDVPSDGSPETRDLTELFNYYRQGLANLTQLRKINDASIRQLTGAFRGQKGENHVIVLLERELRPVPRREALNILADMPKYAFNANELFLTGNTKEPFPVAALAEYFKQVPLTLHFIYITSKNTSTSGSVIENSGDVYSAFSKLAEATGGIRQTSSEPAGGLEFVLKAWKEAK